jgi:hypothetical protein
MADMLIIIMMADMLISSCAQCKHMAWPATMMAVSSV